MIESKTHYLKTWPEFYKEVESGKKKFELRKDDRDFQVGDILVLEEWDPKEEDYTGKRFTSGELLYKLVGGQFGLKKGYCILNW